MREAGAGLDDDDSEFHEEAQLFRIDVGVAFRLGREFPKVPYAVVRNTVFQCRPQAQHCWPDTEAYRASVEQTARKRLRAMPLRLDHWPIATT